jgi:hypothetical protein
VTLFAGSTCATGNKALGKVETCYSSNWMYYSIEGCRAPTASVAVGTSVGAVATSFPTNTGGSDKRDTRRDGFIAGTIVATISGAALVFTGVLVLLRRRPRAKPIKSHELSNEHGLVETLSVEKQVAKELWADHAAVEIGRNSQFETQEGEQDEDESNPVVRIHLVI